LKAQEKNSVQKKRRVCFLIYCAASTPLDCKFFQHRFSITSFRRVRLLKTKDALKYLSEEDSLSTLPTTLPGRQPLNVADEEGSKQNRNQYEA
jgi:hypothetical protein